MAPEELPPDRFCNLVEYWWTRSMKQDDRDRFKSELSRPASGSRTEQMATGAWSREAELSQFRTAGR